MSGQQILVKQRTRRGAEVRKATALTPFAEVDLSAD